MNTNFKNSVVHTIKINQFLDKVFTSKLIPDNSFIDKGRTGIGGTTLELEAHRPSIIVMNRVTAIVEKAEKMNKKAKRTVVLPVYGDHNDKAYIQKYLKSDVKDKKILVTPESLNLFMEAAKALGMTKEITETYFMLVDEQHSYYIESFRERALIVFEYFWSFKNKALISATPILPSDPRFRELEYHKVKFKERSLNTVTLVEAASPIATLRYILSSEQYSDFNLHIFYNTVKSIGKIVNDMGLPDCNIFCADSGRNKEKLGEAAKFFQSKPPLESEGYKKVNFYTSKYLESWDMVDEQKSVFITVTDIHKEHSLLTIKEQLVQCIGRLRNKQPEEIIHITNHRDNPEIKRYDEICDCYLNLFHDIIKGYNAFLDVGIPGMGIAKEFIENFAVHIGGGKYQFNHNKFDQVIHRFYSGQVYNHIRYIEKEWEDNTLYQPIWTKHTITEEDSKKEGIIKGRTEKERLKQIIDKLHIAKLDSDTNMFFLGKSEWEKCQELYPDECRIYIALGLEGIEECQYSQSKIQKAMILASREETEMKLMMLVNNAFEVGEFYANDDIKAILQGFYDNLDIHDVKNKRAPKRTAAAKHIENWYECYSTSRNTTGGKVKSGFKITGKKPALLLLKLTS